MQILLIRHGQSEADIIQVHEGRADYPLTELGVNQAKQMAPYVAANFPVDIILSSPLRRASKTAEILQEKTSTNIIYLKELMEYNNGFLAGMNKAEAAIKYPLPPEGRPIYEPILDGESQLEFRFRVEYIFHKILHDYKDCSRIAIVSHGGIISNFIKVFLGINNEITIFPTADTGVHLLEIRGNQRIIHFLNRTNHLHK